MAKDFRDVNILLVDDDRVDVRAVTRALRKENLSNAVQVASDGVEALAMLRGEDGHQPLPRPYLILLDLKMPRMDGIQFLREIRRDERLSDSIIFVLTTSNSDEDKVAAYKQHIAGYLLKSDAGEGFLKLVKMLERFVVTVQFPPSPASVADTWTPYS